MHQRGGLKRVAGRLVREETARQRAKFGIDERKEAVSRAALAAMKFPKQLRSEMSR